MTFLLHKRVSRIALTVFLLVATQLAFAGQLCSSVMPDSVANGTASMQPGGGVTETTGVSADPQPCCDHVPPAMPCMTGLGAQAIAAIASGGPSHPDLASAVEDTSTGIVARALPGPVPRATLSVGPPLPAYILLARFLS